MQLAPSRTRRARLPAASAGSHSTARGALETSSTSCSQHPEQVVRYRHAVERCVHRPSAGSPPPPLRLPGGCGFASGPRPAEVFPPRRRASFEEPSIRSIIDFAPGDHDCNISTNFLRKRVEARGPDRWQQRGQRGGHTASWHRPEVSSHAERSMGTAMGTT